MRSSHEFPARSTRALSSSITLALLLCTSARARADWNLPRADVQRTGVARGVGDLRAPAVLWRHYLGGAISSRGALLEDVDGDGAIEVVFVSGGKLVAKQRDDRIAWQTAVYGISTVIGIRDFDGDGAPEIAARSNKQVFLVDPGTGEVRWSSPPGEFGFIDDVRVGDLSGDGLDDLFVQSCPCCRVTIASPGAAFSFAQGFLAPLASQRMWTLPSTSCGGRYSMGILDVDGDGRSEVTYSDSAGIGVLHGRTGKPCVDGSACEPCVNGTSEPDCQPNPALVPLLDLGSRANAAHCTRADLDGDGDHELVCLQNNSAADQPDAAHRLFALDYTPPGPTRGAALAIRWQTIIGQRPRLVAFGADPIVDLDGDGALEIAVAGALEDGERWVTYIVDAASGAIIDEIMDQRIVGAADFQGGPGKVLFTSADDTLHAWSFDRRAAPRVTARWSLPARAVITQTDLERSAESFVAERIVVRDTTGDQVAELLARATSPGGHLLSYDVTGGTPVEVASFSTNPTVEILTAWAAPPLATDGVRIFLASSDGIMRALDSTLVPENKGLRFGGYYPKGDWRNLEVTAVTGDLGLGGDSVIISDARGALIRIDARDATVNVSPRVGWSLPRTSAPIIVPALDGDDPGIVCRQTLDDGLHRLQVVAADGRVLRAADVGGQLLSDIVPARIDNDSTADFYIQWGEPGILDLHIEALSGATLESLFHTVPPFEGTTRFPAGGAVLDFDADGADDFVHQYYRTQVISGATGEILAQTPANGLYFMPMLVDLDDDAAPELVLQGGFDSVRALDHDLAPLWTSSQDNRPYPYGALATCPDGTPYLIEGSLAQPSTVTRTNLDLSTLQGGEPADIWTRVLAGGQLFETVADAEAAGIFLGQLTSSAVHEDLRGDGRPIALLGSEDGFLYAIDVCAAELAFVVPLAASVGAISFGDTDGDGTDEVLVAAADGYLYALDNAPVASPEWVIDTDPKSGIVDEDVDLLQRNNSMSALWQAVPGADGYEIAIIRADGSAFVTSPPWQAVGNVTSATVSDLALEYQTEYAFLVRARQGADRSLDVASDGVLVELGYQVGCGCDNGVSRAPGPDGRGGLVLVVLVCGALLMRRRISRAR